MSEYKLGKEYESASDLFGKYKMLPRKGIGGGERGELLRFFCEQLNPSRIKSGYPPLTEKAIIRILPYMNDIRSLFWLKSVCNQTPNFSKKFWYLAKQQKSVSDLVI